jgi:hypothetical protein
MRMYELAPANPWLEENCRVYEAVEPVDAGDAVIVLILTAAFVVRGSIVTSRQQHTSTVAAFLSI